ncbi:MAG: hypothetical protein ABI557_21355 [Aureliella sp.]
MNRTIPLPWLRRNSSQSRWLLAWILAAFLTAASSSQAQEFGQGVVLLKETDRVLTGRILQRANFYEIELAPDSRVSIPKDKVARVAASLLELYQFKRSSMSQNSIGDHFQLTRWCLSNGLLTQAVDHYAVVAQLNPNHPRVKQLGVELEEQLLRDEAFREYLGLAPLTPAATATATTTATKPIRIVSKNPGTSPAVVTASTFEAGRAGYPETVGHPEVARRFTQRVEPILLSRCSQAACHGARSTNGLRLLEPFGRTHARTTSDNLASVLKQIEGTQFDDTVGKMSPLIQYATRAHGTQLAPAITFAETKLVQELQDWIGIVQYPVVTAVLTGPSFDRYPVHAPAQADFAMGTVPSEFRAPGLNPVAPGGNQLRSVPKLGGRSPAGGAQIPTPFPVSGFPVGTQPPSEAELDSLEAQLKAALGEQTLASDPSAPIDPFDPGEFNRKTHSQH